MSLDAMKQALEALGSVGSFNPDVWAKIDSAEEALRLAIEQAERQEPVAWADLLKEADQIVRSNPLWKQFIDGTPLSSAIAVWMADFAQKYTAPPQRQPLTDEEIKAVIRAGEYDSMEEFARAIERAHGIGGGE